MTSQADERIDDRPAVGLAAKDLEGATRAARRKRSRRREVVSGIAYRVVPFVVVFVVWQILANEKIFPGYLFPSPTSVASKFGHLVQNGELLTNFGDSMERVALGYIPALGGGILVGSLMGLSRRAEQMLQGPIIFLNAIPALGWVPIAILWFHIGTGTIVFIIFLSGFFPVVMNTYQGIRGVAPQFVNVAKMNEANPVQMLLTVYIPGALPSIMTGVRLGAAYGFRGMVGAEFFASTSGIGFIMVQARQYLDTQTVIVGMIAIGIVWCVIEYGLMRPLEKATIERWGMLRVKG